MNDPKTTISGIIAAIASIVDMFLPGVSTIAQPIQAIALFFLGLFAKDKS